ncbi:MAG TPA: CHRD domain-containing protein, partial [Gemmatimonadaceae bacterium]|nr:CHRD domain-containing protein [Gemmatimonadaceae bacterium]
MHRFTALLLLHLLACAEPSSRATAPDSWVVPLFSNADGRNFQTHLSGDAETPPRETQAQGNVKFQLAKDGSSIEYQLMATNIDNIVAAHIHLGPP